MNLPSSLFHIVIITNVHPNPLFSYFIYVTADSKALIIDFGNNRAIGVSVFNPSAEEGKEKNRERYSRCVSRAIGKNDFCKWEGVIPYYTSLFKTARRHAHIRPAVSAREKYRILRSCGRGEEHKRKKERKKQGPGKRRRRRTSKGEGVKKIETKCKHTYSRARLRALAHNVCQHARPRTSRPTGGSARVNTRGHARRNYTSACKYNEACVSLWFMQRLGPRARQRNLSVLVPASEFVENRCRDRKLRLDISFTVIAVEEREDFEYAVSFRFVWDPFSMFT